METECVSFVSEMEVVEKMEREAGGLHIAAQAALSVRGENVMQIQVQCFKNIARLEPECEEC